MPCIKTAGQFFKWRKKSFKFTVSVKSLLALTLCFASYLQGVVGINDYFKQRDVVK